MIDSIRHDPATRRLVIIAGVLMAAALLFAGFTVVGNLTTPPPTPIPLPTEPPTRTPRPTNTPQPTPTNTVFVFDTPVPTDPPRPTDTPEPLAAEGTATPQAGSGPGPAQRTPLARPIRYVAVGASDTVGVGADNPDTQAWPVIVNSHLPADTQFQRAARGGITLGEALSTEVGQAIAAKPTLITVWLAANDFTRQVPLPTYSQQLDALLTRLTGATEAQIVVLNLPDLSLVLPATAAPGGAPEIQARVRDWNHAIETTIAQYGDRVLLVDLFSQSDLITTDSSVISGDNWHPSTKGYAKIGDYVYAQMKAAGLVP